MTGHAVCTESQEMFSGERLINLQVAISTSVLIKRGGISIYMAILTNKGRPVCFCLMSGQFERYRVVVECGGTPAIRAVTGTALSTQ